MSQLPPSSRDNPLLNTNQPQREGYLTPASNPPPAPAPNFPPATTPIPAAALTAKLPPDPPQILRKPNPPQSTLASAIDTL
ncbi:MAG: hypothetical protein WCI73_17320, partial [Phycisphaerae bacterium]